MKTHPHYENTPPFSCTNFYINSAYRQTKTKMIMSFYMTSDFCIFSDKYLILGKLRI